jgi:hypothetical protein
MTFGSTFGRTFSPSFQPKSQAVAKAGGITDPTDISNCKYWFDLSDADTMFTDNGSTKVSTDDDKIYRINDKAGNGYYLIQATESKRPTYQTNVTGGKSAGLSVKDSKQELLPGSGFNYGSTGDTAFVVAAWDGSGGINAVIGVPYGQFGVESNGNLVCYLGGFLRSAAGLVSSGNWYALSIDQTSAGVTNMYKNGTSVATGDLGNLSSSKMFGLFSGNATNWFGGYIAECIVYSGILSSADRTQVETYLNNKWAIY